MALITSDGISTLALGDYCRRLALQAAEWIFAERRD
jgi:hypothetical protein